MTKALQTVPSGTSRLVRGALMLPVWLLVWPVAGLWRTFYKHFLAYLIGTKVHDRKRVYSVKFVWYGDSVYLHPMVWGSFLLYLVAISGAIPAGFLLLAWFAGLAVCYLTIMYNFNVIRTAILGVGLVALFGLAYVATVEFAWNPLMAVAGHVARLEAGVTPGFYIVAAYLFAALIASEVVWAWLFHRVEIDESYVYEHGFLLGSTREPIFARGMKRETKDLLELLLLGAADIQHRTKNGFKRFKNVPFASLWLGTAIDSLLDHRRKGEIELTSKTEDAATLVRAQDALSELEDEMDDGGDDGDFENDDGDVEDDNGADEVT
ncbi:MAG: hypothetical protein QGG71_15845 [Pirellulaceae bacterium]|jgi:hypothetical protein|nr:hypothetical protein [Pirellulaceae bacterium]